MPGSRGRQGHHKEAQVQCSHCRKRGYSGTAAHEEACPRPVFTQLWMQDDPARLLGVPAGSGCGMNFSAHCPSGPPDKCYTLFSPSKPPDRTIPEAV